MAERLVEEQREHIRQLKRELEEERNIVKNVRHEKTREVKGMRDEMEAKHGAEKEEMKQKLQQQMQTDTNSKLESQRRDYESQIATLKKTHSTELQSQLKKCEREKREMEDNLRESIERKIKQEMELFYESEKNKLIQETFQAHNKMIQLEENNKNLQLENRTLKNNLQSQDKDHQKEISQLNKQARTDSQKQVDELREKDRQLQEKEKELADLQRKCAQLEATRDKLNFDLDLQRKANTPFNVHRSTPVSTHKEEMSPSSKEEIEEENYPASPTKSIREEELLMKNSELGFLVKKLRDETQKLKTDKAKLEGKVNVIEGEIETLRNRHMDNMRKIHDLHNSLSVKEKKVIKINDENTELRSSKEQLEKQLVIEHESQKSKDRKKIVELQKLRTQLQEKEKEIQLLKEQMMHHREDHKKVEHEIQTMKKEKMDTKTVQISPTKKTPESALIAKRISDHKKRVELEQKVEELTTKLEDANRNKARLTQRVSDLDASLKRRDKQMKALSDENYKLKSSNQLLEESRDRKYEELMDQWRTSHNDLDRAHAQINKLQQKNSSLHERVIELERTTPSPPLISITPTSSSPPPAPTSPRHPSPSPTSPPLVMVSDTPPSPLSQVSHYPLRSISPFSYEEDQFGSQWSLASNESIMKEQIEQLEYGRDEITIKYDEMKKEYGRMKGLYNTLQERYKSLLGRCRNMQTKYQLTQQERLQMEKELGRMQLELESEYDIEREKNLREQLKISWLKIAELHKKIEEHENKEKHSENKDAKIDELKETITQLEQQLNQQEDQLSISQSLLAQNEVVMKEKLQHVVQLEKKIAEKEGQLEGERAIISALQQQQYELREETRHDTSSVLSSPPQHHSPLPSSALKPHLQDCLQSAQGLLSEIHKVVKAKETASTTDSCEYLTEQLKGILDEAQNILQSQHSSPRKEETDAPSELTSSGGLRVSGNEKFQQWLAQFQNERGSLKSKITELEGRLLQGSRRVMELQGLVGELEGRLSTEQNLHTSLLGEKDEQITILSQIIQSQQQKVPPQVLLTFGQQIRQAFLSVTEAIDSKNIDSIRKEVAELEKIVNQFLRLVYGIPDYKEGATVSQHRESTPSSSFTDKLILSPVTSFSPTRPLSQDHLPSPTSRPILEGHLSSPQGHISSPPSRPISEGHLSLVPGHTSSLPSRPMSEGHLSLPPGHMSSQPSRPISEDRLSSPPGHMSSPSSRPISEGHLSSPPGHMSSPPSRPISEGHLYLPPSHMSSPPSRPMSEGHLSSPPGHMSSPPSRPISEGHLSSPPGHMSLPSSRPISEGHLSLSPSHMSSPPSRPISEGHLSSPPGHMSSQPSRPVSEDCDLSLSPSPVKIIPLSSYSSPVRTSISMVDNIIDQSNTGGNIPRLFVTLFDYNPDSLCSTGHPERELNVHTGDVIAVISNMDSAGYYTAVFEGRCGLVPASFVQEIQMSDKDALHRLLNQSLSCSPSLMGSEIDICPVGRKAPSTKSQSTEALPAHIAQPAPPTNFHVEQSVGNDTLLIAWKPPSLDENGQSNGCNITGYSIFCDGFHKVEIIQPTDNHVILEGINPYEPHTLSICTTSKEGPSSELATLQYMGHIPIPLRTRVAEIKQSTSARSSTDSELLKTKLMKALYNYVPADDSPNPQPELELGFEKGQVLTIYGDMRQDGYYYGELGGKCGLVPSNFLIDIETEDTPTTGTGTLPQNSQDKIIYAMSN